MHAFSCHVHMHTCSSRGGGGCLRGGAEPQEPQGQALQQEDRGESAQGPSHPSTEPQTQGKPWCTTY